MAATSDVSKAADLTSRRGTVCYLGFVSFALIRAASERRMLAANIRRTKQYRG